MKYLKVCMPHFRRIEKCQVFSQIYHAYNGLLVLGYVRAVFGLSDRRASVGDWLISRVRLFAQSYLKLYLGVNMATCKILAYLCTYARKEMEIKT